MIEENLKEPDKIVDQFLKLKTEINKLNKEIQYLKESNVRLSEKLEVANNEVGKLYMLLRNQDDDLDYSTGNTILH